MFAFGKKGIATGVPKHRKIRYYFFATKALRKIDLQLCAFGAIFLICF